MSGALTLKQITDFLISNMMITELVIVYKVSSNVLHIYVPADRVESVKRRAELIRPIMCFWDIMPLTKDGQLIPRGWEATVIKAV